MKLNMIFKIFLLGCLILGLQLCACHEANLAKEKSLNAEESSSIAESFNDRNPNLKPKVIQTQSSSNNIPNGKNQNIQTQDEIKKWYAKGYNVAYSNGFNKEIQDGFGDKGEKDPIFDTTKLIEPAKNSNNKFKTPEGFEVMDLKGCTNSFSSKVINSSKELKDEFSTGIGVNGGFMGISFSANTDYEKMENSLNNEETTYVSNKARCGRYRVLVNFYDPPNPDQNLVKALQDLSGKKFDANNVKHDNNKKFWDFIDTSVGTHYIKEYVLGSIYSSTLEIKKETSKQMKKSKLDVSASVSYLAFASFDSSVSIANQSQVDTFRKDIKIKHYTSGYNSTSIKFDDFVKEATNNPDVISIEVKPIMDLLTNENFKSKVIKSQYYKKDGLSWEQKAKKDYDSIVNQLKIAYDNYGSYLGKQTTEKNTKEDVADNQLISLETPLKGLPMVDHLEGLPVVCPEGSALSYIKLNTVGHEQKFSYMCIESTGITSECYERQTKVATIDDGYSVQYLDRHYMECDEDQLMTEFALINHTDYDINRRQVNFKYKCCNAKVRNCKDFFTHKAENGFIGDEEKKCCTPNYLDRFTIDTREEGMKFGISAFGMTRREKRYGHSGKKCQVFPSSGL